MKDDIPKLAVPLAVDLDGMLCRADTLHEALLAQPRGTSLGAGLGGRGASLL